MLRSLSSKKSETADDHLVKECLEREAKLSHHERESRTKPLTHTACILPSHLTATKYSQVSYTSCAARRYLTLPLLLCLGRLLVHCCSEQREDDPCLRVDAYSRDHHLAWALHHVCACQHTYLNTQTVTSTLRGQSINIKIAAAE